MVCVTVQRLQGVCNILTVVVVVVVVVVQVHSH